MLNKIQLLELVEPPPYTDEVGYDACLKATDKDFDLAKHIRPDLHFSESEGCYKDKEFGYLCLNLKVKRIRLGGGYVEQPVWYRISGSWQSGGHWEPDTYEEYVVDQTAGFRSLADACIQSALDSLEHGLVETDNTCPQCYGACEDYDGSIHTCPKCKGKGYIPLCVPPVRILSDEDLNLVREARAKFQYLFDEFTDIDHAHWHYGKQFLSKLLSEIPDNNPTNNQQPTTKPVNIIQKLYALFNPAALQPSQPRPYRRGRKPLAHHLSQRQLDLAKGWEGNTNKLSKKLRCSWQAAQKLRDTAHR